MDAAKDRVSPRLVKSITEGVSLIECGRPKQSVRTDYKVGLAIEVLPRDVGAWVDRQRHRFEHEVFDADHGRVLGEQGRRDGQ